MGLGPAILLQYCLQGLFHPARKVREIYWRVHLINKVYNNLCIGNQDALVSFYPKVENTATNRYERVELAYVL